MPWALKLNKIIFALLYVPDRNQYHKYFVWVKAAWEYIYKPSNFHVPIFLKFWILNLLENSLGVKECIKILYPFIYEM
jgi:hypothetical protein